MASMSWLEGPEQQLPAGMVVNASLADLNDASCWACGGGGDMVCCDGCPAIYHMECVGLRALPRGDWYCAACSCSACGQACRGPRLDLCTQPQLLPVRVITPQPSADPKGVPRGKGYLGPNALRQWLAECAALKAGGQIAAAGAPETAVVKDEAAAPVSADAAGAGSGAKKEGDSDEEGSSSDEDSAGKRRREEDVLPHGKRTKTGAGALLPDSRVRCACCMRTRHTDCLSSEEQSALARSVGQPWLCSDDCKLVSWRLAQLCCRGLMQVESLADGTPVCWQLLQPAALPTPPPASTSPTGTPQPAAQPPTQHTAAAAAAVPTPAAVPLQCSSAHAPGYPASELPALAQVLEDAEALLAAELGPVPDVRTLQDVLPWIVAGRKTQARGGEVDLSNTHLVLLWAGVTLAGVAIMRCFGKALVEVPLMAVAKALQRRHLGHLLARCVEQVAVSVGVEAGVVPLLSDAVQPTVGVSVVPPYEGASAPREPLQPDAAPSFAVSVLEAAAAKRASAPAESAPTAPVAAPDEAAAAGKLLNGDASVKSEGEVEAAAAGATAAADDTALAHAEANPKPSAGAMSDAAQLPAASKAEPTAAAPDAANKEGAKPQAPWRLPWGVMVGCRVAQLKDAALFERYPLLRFSYIPFIVKRAAEGTLLPAIHLPRSAESYNAPGNEQLASYAAEMAAMQQMAAQHAHAPAVAAAAAAEDDDDDRPFRVIGRPRTALVRHANGSVDQSKLSSATAGRPMRGNNAVHAAVLAQQATAKSRSSSWGRNAAAGSQRPWGNVPGGGRGKPVTAEQLQRQGWAGAGGMPYGAPAAGPGMGSMAYAMQQQQQQQNDALYQAALQQLQGHLNPQLSQQQQEALLQLHRLQQVPTQQQQQQQSQHHQQLLLLQLQQQFQQAQYEQRQREEQQQLAQQTLEAQQRELQLLQAAEQQLLMQHQQLLQRHQQQQPLVPFGSTVEQAFALQEYNHAVLECKRMQHNLLAAMQHSTAQQKPGYGPTGAPLPQQHVQAPSPVGGFQQHQGPAGQGNMVGSLLHLVEQQQQQQQQQQRQQPGASHQQQYQQAQVAGIDELQQQLQQRAQQQQQQQRGQQQEEHEQGMPLGLPQQQQQQQRDGQPQGQQTQTAALTAVLEAQLRQFLGRVGGAGGMQ